jgi:hypothetical protein
MQTTSYMYNRRACSTIDSRDVTTTTNVPGNKMYVPLISPSPSLTFSLLTLRYMVADPGYDDKKL